MDVLARFPRTAPTGAQQRGPCHNVIYRGLHDVPTKTKLSENLSVSSPFASR
jgi:hypothetical protein